MSGVIDDAQAILVSDVLDFLSTARLTIDMYRHDGRCARRDGSLDAIRVDAARCGVDIDKHRLDAVPPQRVCRGHKTVGRSDDLAADVECLQRRDERQRAVCKQADVWHLEVFT